MRINSVGPNFKGTFQISCIDKDLDQNNYLMQAIKKSKPTGFWVQNVDYDKFDGNKKPIISNQKDKDYALDPQVSVIKVSFDGNDKDKKILNILDNEEYQYFYTNKINGYTTKDLEYPEFRFKIPY